MSHAMIKIMIIEDNPAYRKGIGMAIGKTKGMELCHEFGTAAVALQKIPGFGRNGCNRFSPIG